MTMSRDADRRELNSGQVGSALPDNLWIIVDYNGK